MVRFRPILLKNSPTGLFNIILGVLNPSTDRQSSIVGRPERSNFLHDVLQATVNIVGAFTDLGIVGAFHKYTIGGTAAILLVDTDITNVA